MFRYSPYRTMAMVLLGAALGGVLFLLAAGDERRQYNQLTSRCRADLLRAYQLMLQTRAASGGRMPASMQELLQSGILRQHQVEFRDSISGILVTREYRAVSSQYVGAKQVWIVEYYTPSPYGQCQVLTSDGLVFRTPIESLSRLTSSAPASHDAAPKSR